MQADNLMHHVPSSIQSLTKETSNLIRAPAIISSFANVVEELFLNALDVGANFIEIKLNTRPGLFRIECLDNGKGMSVADLQLVSEWHSSSKTLPGTSSGTQSFGSKGEALAAISALSDLEIISKINSSKQAYRKAAREGRVSEANDDMWDPANISGTLVIVRDIFKTVPVRLKCMSIKDEQRKITEFLSKMAMLHHGVFIRLLDTELARPLFAWPPCPSIAHRFRTLHGDSALYKLSSLAVSHGVFSLQGLISPPVPACLEINRNCQYLYVNGRWLRGRDLVSSAINKWYLSLLAPQRTGGPLKVHYDPLHSQRQLFPSFVLSLTVPHDCYDLWSEPDKTVYRYTEVGMRGIEECIAKLKVDMMNKLQEFEASMSADLDDALQEDDGEDKACEDEQDIDDLYAIKEPDKSLQQISPIFRAAFFPTPTSSAQKGARDRELPELPEEEGEECEGRRTATSLLAEFAVQVTRCGSSEECLSSAHTDEGSKFGLLPSSVLPAESMYNYTLTPRPYRSMHSYTPSVINFGTPCIDTRQAMPSHSSSTRQETAQFVSLQETAQFVSPDSETAQFVSLQETAQFVSPRQETAQFVSPDSAVEYQARRRNVNADMERGEWLDGFSYREAGEVLAVPSSLWRSTVTAASTHHTLQSNTTTSITAPALPCLAPATLLTHTQSSEFDSAFFSTAPSAPQLSASSRSYDGPDSVYKKTTGKRPRNAENCAINRLRSVQKERRVDAPAMGPMRAGTGALFTSRNFDFASPKTIQPPICLTSATLNQPTTLHKSMLSPSLCRLVGMCDSKYLLLVSSGVVIIVDQHAADERIKLEQMEALFSNKQQMDESHASPTPTHLVGHDHAVPGLEYRSVCTYLDISLDLAAVIEQRRAAIVRWGFEWVERGIGDNDGEKSAVLQLVRAPVIMGELLTGSDFVEYVHALSRAHSGEDSTGTDAQGLLPDSLCKPPAFHRILASKACRGAIKFGDVLTLREATAVLQGLARSKLPFQCAHGRPSMSPLLHLEGLQAGTDRAEPPHTPSRPRYESLRIANK